MRKNILLAYFLSFTKNSWFWLGIWVFYYLRFTNYAGIGLLETILIATITLFEIPTGAIADLVGKRKTLIWAFVFETVGAFLMAFTPNFSLLALSVFILCVGGALYSGTLEALVFDSLKENGEEGNYDKTISTVNSVAVMSWAVCSVIGGFLYSVNPRLPFILSALMYLVGLGAAFLLREPQVDTFKFSFKNFLKQTSQGLSQLFKDKKVKTQTLLLVSIGLVVVIASEMVDSFLGVEFGFSGEQLGILWAVISVATALVSQMTPFMNRHFGTKSSILIVGGAMAITFVVSPFVGLAFGGISLLLRSSLMGVFGNLSSIAINESTESAHRATTLSTFNMLKNIPYVFLAYFIGSVSDVFSAKTTSLDLGLALMLFLAVQTGLHFFNARVRSIPKGQ